MLPIDRPDRIHVTFDDHRLVANAGLILPVTLAHHLGLGELVDNKVDLGDAPGRANAGDKFLTLVASASAGGDCIDDALRAGGTEQVLGRVIKAPSTLGIFLRSFRRGHVRQLDRVSRELLAVAAGVLMWRLRKGRANTARGAAHFLRETVGGTVSRRRMPTIVPPTWRNLPPPFTHVRTLLKMNGSAAIVLPDNVLFEGGAGETIRRRLLHECDAHTLLRLPTGVFYAQGVKANVLFFDRKPAGETPWTRDLWIYDLRTNQHFTPKTNPLTRAHLDDFVSCYRADDRVQREESERFRRFTFDELTQRDKANLDIFWLRDESLEDSENLPPPDVIAEEIMEDLRAALEQLEEIAVDLGGEVATADAFD